ncbi:M10 family metallopeptidase C-terminal domain-containing protein [Rhizobium sp. TRM95111]|uniref:M10 family metallopeptidase n=1 Tax=Rhizobium alarense TaxID=2846851 RepID=UPI001F268B12|nr:M10 family metallopeptidase [Rhizobium alarense]MCF3641114.1 M10 family metallopeptidase C-terminal domain-containing protein [Rhizobium alarense]
MTGTNKTTKSINETNSQFVDSVLSGFAWSGGTVTYAFPTSKGSYDYTPEKNNNFAAVSQQQKNAALFAMEQSFGNTANNGFSVEGFTKLNFNAGSNDSATLRFAQSDEASPTAYAYYPSTSKQGGDIWFSTNYAGTSLDYRTPTAGNYAWHTLLHELGHALGLKHAHETDTFGAMPSQWDTIEYSIMTYRPYQGGSTGSGYQYEEFGGPQTFMMADIAALQHMYGADYSTNSGNTVYKWKPGSGETLVNGKVAIDPGANRIFATIWDGGGKDTYDLSAYNSDLSIDLRPGAYSEFSDAQLAYLGGGPNGGYARGHIFNALLYKGNLASLIENAKGGSGDDFMYGNQGKNQFNGGKGADDLYGNTGNDKLYGGNGQDHLEGGKGNDLLDGGKDGQRDELKGNGGKDDFVFKKGFGNDVILDFQDGSDDIDLKAFNLTFSQVKNKMTDVGSDIEIDLGGGNVILVKNIDKSDFVSGDFLL